MAVANGEIFRGEVEDVVIGLVVMSLSGCGNGLVGVVWRDKSKVVTGSCWSGGNGTSVQTTTGGIISISSVCQTKNVSE